MKKKSVLFYSSVKDKELFRIQRFYQVDINILESLGYNVILSNSISDAFKYWKYSFVFAYFYRYSFAVALIAKLFRKDTFFTGGIDSLEKSISNLKGYREQKILFLICYILARKCIIVSKTDYANVKDILGNFTNKLIYSEHTIDMDCKAACHKKEHILTTIGWQGTDGNVKRKGIDKSLYIFSKLKKDGILAEDYKFYIIGKTGEGTDYIKSIVRNLNIDDSVVITGAVSEEEKISYLSKSKYYFQLSTYEGFGVASLEALYYKNIAVCSGKGGLSNPIYKDCILFNIDEDINESYPKLVRLIQNYDDSVLETIREKVLFSYNNERRKNDFQAILPV